MDFRSLQHILDSQIHSRGLCLPAAFRPQGLATLSTACSLRTRAGFISRRQRSWDSPFGAFSSCEVSERYHPEAPTYRFSRRCSHRTRRRGGAAGRGFWGLTLARVLWRPKRVFSTPAAGCSPGICPSWASQPKPWRRFRPASSHALHDRNDARSSRRHLRVSISLDLVPSSPRANTRPGRNNPSRVFAPARSLAFKRCPPGL
jgi:hypothetical protein